LAGLRHPGPRVVPRVAMVRGRVGRDVVDLRAGESLLDGLGRQAGKGALVVDLAGMEVAEGAFVQPADATDAAHAAWYSTPREMAGVRIRAGVAMVGSREGAPFVHAHALWEEGGRTWLGHLLCDRVRVCAGRLEAMRFTGGSFVQAHDIETNFTLFRATGEGVGGPAAILTVRPHEELGAVLAGFGAVRVMGLGSLIGARFREGEAMESPISEMLVMPGATGDRLEVTTVDLEGRVFGGVLAAGGGEVCVTAELLVWSGPG
jgi:hypothetical protein